MGLFSDALGSLTGANAQNRALKRAANSQLQSILKASGLITEGADDASSLLRKGFGKTMNLISGGGAFDLDQYGQGLTLKGYGQQLSDIMDPNGMFGNMMKERQRAATSALSAAGLSRSGNAAEAASQIPTELAMAIQEMMFGRQAGTMENMANLTSGLFGNLANLKTSTAGSLANLETGAGQVKADMNTAMASTNPMSSLFGGLMAGLGTETGMGALLSGGSKLLAALPFCDERLKTNIQEIGRKGPFTIYSWDWIPEIKALGIEDSLMNYGLIAQDVERVAPEYVFDLFGAKAVDYERLLEDDRWLQ